MYELKELTYNYDALEPYIDTHTLGLHRNKHQKNYLNKLNELLLSNNCDFQYSLEELSDHIDEFSADKRESILFNLGGVVNHNLYFASMSPNKEKPNNLLLNEIENTYGSFEEFKKEFKQSALSIKGSGYTFLVLDNEKIRIVNLLNQDNPYNYKYAPLLALDMWEHGYYINYENKKDIYIDNFFEIADYSMANKYFKEV